MIVGETGSFEGTVTVPVLVFVKVGLKEAWKVQVLPDAMVFPEQWSLPCTSVNCPESVALIIMVPTMRSATPFMVVFLTVKVATAVFPLCTLPKFLYVGVTAIVGFWVKVAVTVILSAMVMLQVDVPAQVDHPEKTAPEFAVAARVTCVPGR